MLTIYQDGTAREGYLPCFSFVFDFTNIESGGISRVGLEQGILLPWVPELEITGL